MTLGWLHAILMVDIATVKSKRIIDSLIVFFMPSLVPRNNDDLAQDIYKNCIGLPVSASLKEEQSSGWRLR